MPRRNKAPNVRAQYAGEIREDERMRRRRRLAQRANHPNRNVNTATYRELSA